MTIDFYFMVDSPPCRSVQMAAAAVGVELNYITLDYNAGEHLKLEFLKINPTHTAPTIKDGDFILWESRAIMSYLVNRYGKDDRYYPKDPVKRALVDQRMQFDLGTLYHCFGDYYYPQILEKSPADPEKYKKMVEAFDFLEKFLEGSKFAAGEELTIADFTLMTTVSSMVDGGAYWCLKKYPNVQRWYEDCKVTIPGYEKTEQALELLKGYFADISPPKVE